MDILFLVSLFLVAFLYSSVGHGGGTGYLALLALFGVAPVFMKSTALTLNVFVSSIAFYSYCKAGYFKWKLIIPFLISSIPFAYLGALTQINASTYKIILGVFLLIAIGRMLLVHNAITETSKKMPFLPALTFGAIRGFFSGIGRPVSIENYKIPDDKKQLGELLNLSIDIEDDIIFTTGGTGIGSRDITPDVIKPLLDKEISGIMEMIRVKCGIQFPNALVSRSIAGVAVKTLIYSLPGNPKAVKEYVEVIFKTVEHSFRMINNIDEH